ncbi:MAG: hypothetical protein KAU31_16305, partial [Spirochaetaceae bacterium]|nr:hypothetical protein [Spirochaetaceae bacterium]
SANATGNVALRVSPFAGSRLWSQSSVNYSVNLLLYQLVYSGLHEETDLPVYDEKWVKWDDDFVRSHQAQLNLALDVLSGQALRLTADLPPQALRFVGQLDFGLSPLSISVASGLLQKENEAGVKSWTYQPITSAQALVLGELGQIQNQISYDVEEAELTYNNTSATVGPVRAQFEWRSTEGFDFERAADDWDGDGILGEGWVGDSTPQFRPTRAAVSANLSSELEPMWRNRLLLGGSLTSSWSMNLLRYTESSLSFGLKTDVEITDFLSLSFSSQSTNTQSYVYVGPLAEGVGRARRSLAVDLLKSFNFFRRQDRIESAFNLQQIRIEATHYLEDWDLEISYSGRPEIVGDPGSQQYDWQSRLDIQLQWRAIRELSSNLRADNQTGTDAGSTWDLTFGNDS